MKRFIALIGLLLFLFSFGPICFAEKVYEDPESDVRFIVPDGWTYWPPYDETAKYKAIYMSNDRNPDYNANFSYAFEDIYSTLPSQTQTAYSREEITNEFFSLSDISSLLNVSESEIHKATYSGISYFTTDIFVAGKTEYIGLKKYITPARRGKVLLRINNGYLYKFSYTISLMARSSRTQEVGDIINSIVYSASTVPYVKKNAAPAKPKPLSSNPNSKLATNVEDDNPIAVLWILMLAIILIGVVVNALKKKKKRTDDEY